MGKIRLKCQIADLKTEVTCSVIENKTSNSLFLGRPWIHANGIVPSCTSLSSTVTLTKTVKYKDSLRRGWGWSLLLGRKDVRTPVTRKTKKTKPKLTLRKHLNDVIGVKCCKCNDPWHSYTSDGARDSGFSCLYLPPSPESSQGAVFLLVGERVKNQSFRGHPSGQIKEGWCGT